MNARKNSILFAVAAALGVSYTIPFASAADGSRERTTMPDFCSNRDVTCVLPDEVGQAISEHSNTMAAQSISKFRNAISTLAFSEGEDRKSGLVSSYLSWKELVHTSYFDVPAFRRIVAQSISQAEGFRATEAFIRDPVHAQTATWVAALGQKIEVDPATGIAIASVQPIERPVAFPA